MSFESLLSKLLEEKSAFLEEAAIFPKMEVEYWNSSVISKDGRPLSAGFSTDRMQARKIAIAEFLERIEVEKIHQRGEAAKQNWGMDRIPTACGFAAGFDRDNTLQRSINEAVERWVTSSWIDGGKYIQELSLAEVLPELDPASLFFISQFEKVRFFRKEVLIWINEKPKQVVTVITLGLTENGVFPGHSTQTTNGSIWSHSLLESFRHFIGVKNNPKTDLFPANKVRYFAENKEIALAQILVATDEKWPQPKVELIKVQGFYADQYFLARTIIAGWVSWEKGPMSRFLY